MVVLSDSLSGGFSYDDFLVLQNRETAFDVNNVDISGYFSRNTPLKLPVVGSPMATVTGSKMAVALALHGGLGVIHYNHAPAYELNSYEVQRSEADAFKRFMNSFISSPYVLSPDKTIEDVVRLGKEQGFSFFPITRDGTSNGVLVGYVDNRSFFASRDSSKKIKTLMGKASEISINWSDISDKTLDERTEYIVDALRTKHAKALLVVDRKKLKYLVTRKDIDTAEEFPDATVDGDGRLKVFAAIEYGIKLALPRLEVIADSIDGVVIDTSHGFTSEVGKLIKEVKKKYYNLDVVAGNVSSYEAVQFLIKNGADGVRIGNGPGGVCSTWDVTMTGRTQGRAVYECARGMCESGADLVPIIADGGIKKTGHPFGALALGAHCVMVGSLLAGTDETPGEVIVKESGSRVKLIRGMASLEEMQVGAAASRYSQEELGARVAEGFSEEVPYKGPVNKILHEVSYGIKKGLFNTGCKTIPELHKYAHIESRSSV